LALDITPVVIQVPDFGERFWVYQVVDLRTDGVVQLGKMYGTTPGYYMVVGPDWHGEVPKGITKVFRSPTRTGFIAPRIFQDDNPEDKRAIQSVLQQVLMYPLAEYDGTMKTKDWSQIKKLPPKEASGDAETKWVFPEKFFDELPGISTIGFARIPAVTTEPTTGCGRLQTTRASGPTLRAKWSTSSGLAMPTSTPSTAATVMSCTFRPISCRSWLRTPIGQ
jgi:hypothetical protein